MKLHHFGPPNPEKRCLQSRETFPVNNLVPPPTAYFNETHAIAIKYFNGGPPSLNIFCVLGLRTARVVAHDFHGIYAPWNSGGGKLHTTKTQNL